MLPKFFKKFFTKRPACAGRKIALFLILCLLFSGVFAKPLLAYSTPGYPSYHSQWENAVYNTDEMNLQSFVFETFKAAVSSVIAFITPCFSCTRQEGVGFGLFGFVGSLIAGIYTTPPASGIDYLADIGQRLNLVSPTYAQGTGVGFEKMRPYMSIWRAFRDISFSFFVIIFIFIGFAIMFRIKISPQAVVTIESALPKLIIALLLITFSYAIVGFMVDIMFVINNLIIATFKNLPGTNIPELIRGWLPSGNITDVGGTLGVILVVGVPPIIVSLLLLVMLGAISTGISAVVSGGAAAPFVGIGALLIILLIVIVFLIALLRVLWTLLKAYVMVVLSLIFSPFIFLVGALPGSNAISAWFRSILANLAVLPTVLVMVFLSGYFTLTALFDIPGMETPVKEYFNPAIPDPTGAIQAMQTIASAAEAKEEIAAFFILFLVSLVILLLAPRAADIIQSFISGQPFAYGTAIGESLTGTALPVAALSPRIKATRIRGKELFPADTTRRTIFDLIDEIARKKVTGGGR